MNAEVNLDYKKTEMGVIPQDWDIKRLRDISPFQTVGLVINPSSYFDEAGTVPMLVGSHVSENSISWQSANKITERSNNQISTSRLYADDLVMVRVGDPGVAAVIPPELNGCNCASMMIIRQGKGFDSNWLCFVMNSDIGRKQVENVQYGTAQKQFNISDAINFIYPTPPLAEQRAIASVLCGVDTLINNLDQLIAKKRDIQQAVMQQLFTGKRRLPRFSEQWEETCLGGVVERFVGGGTPSRNVPEYWGGNIPWITVKDFATFNPWTSQEYITLNGLKSSASSLIPAGTLITSTRMALGKAVIYQVDVTINQDLKALVIKSSLNVKFLYYWFKLKEKSIDELGSGSTVKGLSLLDLRSIPFQLPGIEEQQAIATILSDMDAEIATLEARRDKAKQLKKGMMQELLTGRIRLV